MSKTKLERKLKIIGEYRKGGRSLSGKNAKRVKKRSVRGKLDKLLAEGYDELSK